MRPSPKLKEIFRQAIASEEQHRKELKQCKKESNTLGLDHSIKVSSTSEKIFRYAYNNNKTEVRKYIDKLKKLYMEVTDDLTFNPEKCVCCLVDMSKSSREDDYIGIDKSDSGRIMLDEMKGKLEEFEMIYKLLDK